jgi:hypothetical protein
MKNQDKESPSPDMRAEDPPNDVRGTPPQGNPDRDHESVEKGKEQLGKIAGN